jgi:hypothetical protein
MRAAFVVGLASAGLFVLSALAFAGGARPPAPVRVSGPSPLAHCEDVRAPHGTGIAYTNAEVEPYVAVNPRTVRSRNEHIVGVWQQDRWSTVAARGLVAAFSRDDGRSWVETPLPFTACVDPALSETRASDPWVSVGPDGIAYASGVTTGPRLNAIVVVTSGDGGKTWGRPRAVIEEPNSVGYNDKPSVTADPVRPGTAYVVWNRNRAGDNPPQPTWFSRTRDGGRTWSAARPITFQSAPNTGTLGNQILADPRRRVLYDIFERYVQPARFRLVCTTQGAQSTCRRVRRHVKPGTTENEIGVIVSHDAGDSWTRPRTIAADMGIGVKAAGTELRTGLGVPEPALDTRSGCLYVTWEDARFSGLRVESIALTKSCDEGGHWSAPRQVVANGDAPEFTPAIAVGTSGSVGITYYRLSARAATAATLPVTYWYTSSSNGGRRFSRPRYITGPFNMKTAPDSSGLFLGDYEALVADGAGFRAFFVAANSLNLRNRTDVYTTALVP